MVALCANELRHREKRSTGENASRKHDDCGTVVCA